MLKQDGKPCGTRSELRLLDPDWTLWLCRFNVCYSIGSIKPHLIMSCYLEMLKVVWKILFIMTRKSPWETGATKPSVYAGSVTGQCLLLLSFPFAQRLKTSFLCSGKLINKTGLSFLSLFEGWRNWVLYPTSCFKSLLVIFQSCNFSANHICLWRNEYVCTCCHPPDYVWLVNACFSSL